MEPRHTTPITLQKSAKREKTSGKNVVAVDKVVQKAVRATIQRDAYQGRDRTMQYTSNGASTAKTSNNKLEKSMPSLHETAKARDDIHPIRVK